MVLFCEMIRSIGRFANRLANMSSVGTVGVFEAMKSIVSAINIFVFLFVFEFEYASGFLFV